MNFLLSIFFIFTRSDDCEIITGQTFNTQFERKPSTDYCFAILNSIFMDIISETSGGAIAIRNGVSTGVIHDCTFIQCQSKAQAACIYFSGLNLETFGCCSVNCTTRYSSMFLSSQLKDTKQRTVVDMLTIDGSSSQENAISLHNGHALLTNINMTNSLVYGTLLALELTDIESPEVAYTNFVNNKGDVRDNSIIYLLTEFTESTQVFHHGNYIKNTCTNGGYIFNAVALTHISDSVFQNNSRTPLQVIRYYVTFESCVFDGAEIRTDFETITNCQFLTGTSPLEFTLQNCSDISGNLKLSSTNKEYIVKFSSYGYVLMVVGIVALVAIISMIIVKTKQNHHTEEDKKDEQNTKENQLSTTPLIE